MRWIIFYLFLIFTSLHAVPVSKHPHSQYIPSTIKYDHILSANESYRKQIIEKVKGFPLINYEIHRVTNLGLFFLDAKPDWIKDILKNNSPWEGYIQQLIQKYVKTGTTVLDVGAHIGTHTLTLSRAVGPQGRVIAFEPQPKTFCELFMNAEINEASNVFFFWGALGDKFEEINLPNFNPQVEVTYIYNYDFGHSENNAPMIPLDSLNLTNISFMKVDVDGCDNIFIDGAKETILRNKPVMVMEILGVADINSAPPAFKQQILNTQKKITDLGYQLKRVSIHDYLCIPLEMVEPETLLRRNRRS